MESETIVEPILPTLVITTEAEHYVALDKTFCSPSDSISIGEAIVLGCSSLEIEPEHYMLVEVETQKRWAEGLMLPEDGHAPRFTRLVLVRKDARPYCEWPLYTGTWKNVLSEKQIWTVTFSDNSQTRVYETGANIVETAKDLAVRKSGYYKKQLEVICCELEDKGK